MNIQLYGTPRGIGPTKTHSKWLMLSQLFLRSIVVIPSKNLHIRLGQLYLKKNSPSRMNCSLAEKLRQSSTELINSLFFL